MDFLLTFLEGLASFVSPCMLPMIPLYLSYFAGDEDDEEESAEIVTDGEVTEDKTEVATDEKVTEDKSEVVTDGEVTEEKTEIVTDGEVTEEKTEVATDGEVTEDKTEIVADEESAKDKKKENKKKYRVLVRSLFFVLGFTLMFVVFGGLVGLVSGYINKYKTVINIVAGVIVIIFGLSYIGLFGLPFFKGLKKSYKINSVWSAFLFGMVFAVGVGPCTGAFLGSALALASTSGTALKGIILLLFYSMGIGIPFIITALLTDKTKKLFGFIKRHFKVVKIVSGSLLIVMGILLATGVMDKLIKV